MLNISSRHSQGLHSNSQGHFKMRNTSINKLFSDIILFNMELEFFFQISISTLLKEQNEFNQE
jgi:hypothetical protein